VGLGQERPRIQRDKTVNCSASAFLLSQKSKTKNFLFLFKKIGRAQNLKKCRENFSVSGLKFLQNFRAEAGRRLKIGIGIFVKKSSNFVQ